MIKNDSVFYRERERERERESKLPITLIKLKETYKVWLSFYRNFPKIERLGVGCKIDQAFLDALEFVFLAGFTPFVHKLPLLSKAIFRIDTVKFFIQITWENKLLTVDQYSAVTLNLEEVGRMLWGWKRGIESKTPAQAARET